MSTATKLPRGVKTIAAQVRRDILWRRGDIFGCCHNWSKEVVARLAERGIEARLVRGVFQCDCGHYTHNEHGSCRTRTPLHTWVQIGDWIIDGTATQFQQACEDKIPPVVVGERSELWRYIAAETTERTSPATLTRKDG